MIAGRELKAKCLPPMENSLTRALAAARFLSSNSASCSSPSMAGNIPQGLLQKSRNYGSIACTSQFPRA